LRPSRIKTAPSPGACCVLNGSPSIFTSKDHHHLLLLLPVCISVLLLRQHLDSSGRRICVECSWWRVKSTLHQRRRGNCKIRELAYHPVEDKAVLTNSMRCLRLPPFVCRFRFYIDRRWFKRAHSATYQSAALPARSSKPGKPRCLPNSFAPPVHP